MTVIIKQAAVSQSSASYSTRNSEPEYGSDSYVDKWDESQKNDGSWLILMTDLYKVEVDINIKDV